MPPIKKRKAQPQAAPKGRPIPFLALSIREFCQAHNLSIDSYFRMHRSGLGPQTMKIGARTIISIEAAAAWRREREAGVEARKGGAETVATP